MSLTEVEELEEPEFKWGRKRGIGGKKKDVQFYESFTYDGEDYALYDCVYMYKQGESEPYIGKLVKIWGNADNSKRIKVQWFFQPSEISYYLRDAEVLENEIFFASGAGTGLANLNPLEAIAGKCNVVCISTDSRNPQPSAGELQMADFVFYRVFDVGSCTISDQMGDSVGGLEVKFVFNRKETETTLDIPKLDWTSKDQERNAIAYKETSSHTGKNTPEQLNNLKADENDLPIFEKESDVKQVQVEQESVPGETKRVALKKKPKPELKLSPAVDVKSSKNKEAIGMTIENNSTLGAKNVGCKVNGESDKDENIKSHVNQVRVEKRVKSASKSNNLEDTPLKRAKVDDAVTSSRVKDINGVQNLTIPGNDALAAHLLTSSNAKNSAGSEKDKRNISASREMPSPTDVVSPNEALKLLTTNTSSNGTPKSGYTKDIGGLGQATKLVKSSSSSMKRALKTSADLSKENPTPTPKHDDGHANKDKTLAKDACPTDGQPKKRKVDHNDNNTNKKLKEKICSREDKSSPMLGTSYDDKAKAKLDKSSSKECHSEKAPKLLTSQDNVGKVEAKIFEVTRRPIVEKNKWIKLPWEERMKTAHDQGKLVLLQNLDPEYTSGEVEDIIWFAFKENCTAKMLQHTACSNPHSGQAFVIFNSREAVDRVLQKLDDRCLVLPNKRPLVISTGVSPKFKKNTSFVGHLAIDKARRQIQREMKEAVSTSHYSQNNTIEYEMAMSWCLLQSKSDKWWEKLYEQQRKELNKLTDNLKLK